METRKLDEIVWREDLYPRLKPDAGQIQTYADDLAVLPPIEVNQDNILIDGYHRWQAHRQAGADSIRVIVTTTPSEAELLRLAIARNATHGLQLTPADKRRYALLWWGSLPDVQICATLSISERTLRRWTSEQREQQDSALDTEIVTRWLRCESQAAIAAATGVDAVKVNRVIAEKFQNGQLSDLKFFPNFSPEVYNVWRFDPVADGAPFAALPPTLLDNLLYYYTEPGAVVFDPFAGSGVTLTVCQQRQRRCYASDLTPTSPEIRQWDSTQGLPEDLPVPDLVLLDPPYWQPDAGADSGHPTDLAHVSLEMFLKTLGDLAKAVKRKWGTTRPNARLALLTGMLQTAEGQFIDLPLLSYTELRKYLDLEMRYQVPYTAPVHPDFVQRAKDRKQCLYLFRDLLVFKRGGGDAEL